MKSQISLFVFFICLHSFTHASVPNFGTPTEDLYQLIAEQVEEEQTIYALDNFVVELQSFVSQAFLIRDTIPKSSNEKVQVIEKLNEINIEPLCTSCTAVVDALKRHATDQGKFQTYFEAVADIVCERHLNKSICVGAVTEYGSIVYSELMDKTFNSSNVCQRFLLCPRTEAGQTVKQYAEEVLKDKPALNIPVPTQRASYTILHLTDPHLDLQYQEGTASVCGEPLCCRAESGTPANNSQAALYWGTVGDCDVPMRTFDQFLQFVSKNYDVDMIMWTGDNIAHDIWHQSATNQTLNTLDATQEILKYFPNTPIYPMFGNHEAFPADEFDFAGNNSYWLTSQLADMWKQWLDDNATSTFRQYSYYATVNQEHNVKIIGLDTIACDTMDFYLMNDPTDPGGQLAWLRAELYDSEAKNQSVLIMGHIPPGDFGCDSRWSARYGILVERFANIIRGQFFGHTHDDQLEIVRSYTDSLPVGVIFIAPSFTTFSNKFPSFRIFDMDADTSLPINYYQYRLDLNKWNSNTTGPLSWDLAYDVLSQYNMADASWASFDNVVEQIKEDSNVAQTYVFNFKSGATPKSPLSPKDLQHYYCEAKHSVSENAFKCLGTKVSIGDLLSLLQQLIPGGWKFADC